MITIYNVRYKNDIVRFIAGRQTESIRTREIHQKTLCRIPGRRVLVGPSGVREHRRGQDQNERPIGRGGRVQTSRQTAVEQEFGLATGADTLGTSGRRSCNDKTIIIQRSHVFIHVIDENIKKI